MGTGTHELEWNGLNDRGHSVESGVYLFKIQADGLSQTRKMIFLK